MQTRWDEINQKFTDKAHTAARTLIYPQLFNCAKTRITFENASVSDGGEKAILDGEMGIDVLINVSVHGLAQPIQYSVQERFRRPSYAAYRDLTITEWNNASSQPSELYKIKAGIFVYGYYDDACGCFGEVIAINVTAFLMALTAGKMPYMQRQNSKEQDFIAVKFYDLHAAGVVVAHFPAQSAQPMRYA